MAKKPMEAAKLSRLKARTRVIQGAARVMLIVCCGALGFVVVATAVPERRTLERLEAKLELAKAREREVVAEREHRSIELRALREDPAYLEIHARDRLDYYQEGERVFRFRRDR